MATHVNGSLDGILKTLIALTSAPWAIEEMQPVGELPASMWIIRGGKARSAPRLPWMSTRSTQPSSAAGLAKLVSMLAPQALAW